MQVDALQVCIQYSLLCIEDPLNAGRCTAGVHTVLTAMY